MMTTYGRTDHHHLSLSLRSEQQPGPASSEQLLARHWARQRPPGAPGVRPTLSCWGGRRCPWGCPWCGYTVLVLLPGTHCVLCYRWTDWTDCGCGHWLAPTPLSPPASTSTSNQQIRERERERATRSNTINTIYIYRHLTNCTLGLGWTLYLLPSDGLLPSSKYLL